MRYAGEREIIMKFTEFTGKTVEEAVEKGLEELGLTEENAEIRVLDEGKKKLFGFTKARVEIASKIEETQEVEISAPNTEVEKTEQTDGERAVEFLEGLFSLLKINACTELVSEGEKIEINVTAANGHGVIGKRGEMLDAFQTLAGAVANTGREDYKRVVVDCENYRESREETLKKLANNLAQKAVRLGKKIQLEPMNPYERRIIHAALSDNEEVKTESEGKEPNRYLVVIPNNLEDPTAPAIPARNERRNDRNGRFSGDNRRGGYNRDRRGNGNRNGGFNRGGNRNGGKRMGGGAPTSGGGGTTMKASSDFFGIFLGNSGKNDEE